MARRDNHYELAVEVACRDRGVPLLAIDENAAARLRGRRIKNFDYVIYRPQSPHLLLEVKGRKTSGARNVNAWVTAADVACLDAWRGVFGEHFEAVFAFVFELPPSAKPNESREANHDAALSFNGRRYHAWAIRLLDYQRHARCRSRAWGTLDIGRAAFRACARPLLPLLGGSRPGAPRPLARDDLDLYDGLELPVVSWPSTPNFSCG